MKTTVIPAQITTVEDKIAGNLNLTQIMLLLVPVIWTATVYTLFAPRMHLAFYKFPLVMIITLVSLILSLRVKGKVVLNWLMVLVQFNLRPKYYIFNKNDSYLRTLDLPLFNKKIKPLLSKAPAQKPVKATTPNFGVKELIQLENFIKKQKLSLSFKTSKKGGFNVAFEQAPK